MFCPEEEAKTAIRTCCQKFLKGMEFDPSTSSGQAGKLKSYEKILEIKSMKKITLVVFTLICFGIAKARMIRTTRAFMQKKFVVTGINRLKNYNVTFNVYSVPVKRWVKKDQIEIVNTIATEVNRTEIVSSKCLRLRSATLNRIVMKVFRH